MERDIRRTGLYREAESLYTLLRRPGTGQIGDGAEINVLRGSCRAVFAGTVVEKLEGSLPTRIYAIDLSSGHTTALTSGPNTDRLPKFAPDGRHIAFLSDRTSAGNFQLYLLDPGTSEVRSTPDVEGWVEYLHWRPDAKRILLGVAGHGADIAGGQGAITSRRAVDVPSWMPTVQTRDGGHRFRRAWIYDLATDRTWRIDYAANIWEAVWCGNGTLAAIVSAGPEEGRWYSAQVYLIDVHSGSSRLLYQPRDQVGALSASPSGTLVAFVEAVCSDRGILAGELVLVEVASGTIWRPNTQGVDVGYTEWLSDTRLLVGGHRGAETVIGLCNTSGRTFEQLWCSSEITTGSRYIMVSGINESGDCALVGEGFTRAPEIAVISQGEYRTVKSLDLGYAECIEAIASIEHLCWEAPDELEVQGWLLRAHGSGSLPLVMNIHGGPVWHWRPAWLGRSGVVMLMLLRKGYAIFLPNPRGSAGRGQDFARRVVGDLGGLDTYDLLSGVDHLVRERIADPSRLGVMGISYGGFMASWLVTRTSRFAAAVPVAAMTNYVTEHLLSNIPEFVSMFLQDDYKSSGGKYFERSPINHAHRCSTPTLNICGALDRCTPSAEAAQFHSALLEHGTRSVLLTYPEEGHGVRAFPAAIDYAARVVGWFCEHMPV